MITPTIAIQLYKRPNYTAKLFKSLEECYGFSDIPCTISVDINEDEAGCTEVWNLAHEFGVRHTNVRLLANNPRLGIDLNKLFVIPKAFERGDYMIFLEDDTGLSKDALRYFIAMGEIFLQDKSVFSVSGYNRVPSGEDTFDISQHPYEYDVKEGFCPWGWACWRDRWDAMYPDAGAAYKEYAGEQANGLFDHWLFGKGLGMAYPTMGRTNHTGWIGSEHTPSLRFLMDKEFSYYGAWSEELPDPPISIWTRKMNSVSDIAVEGANDSGEMNEVYRDDSGVVQQV